MADPREIKVRVLFEADKASAQQAAQQVRQVGQQAGEAFNQGVKPAEELGNKIKQTGQEAEDAALRFKLFGESISLGRILAVIAVYSALHSAISALKLLVHTAWNEWMEMDKAMARVQLATGATGDDLVALNNKIEFFAATAEVGFQGSSELANGLTQLAQAGIRGAEAFEMLKQAGQAAQAGFTDIKTILDATIPVLLSYKDEFRNTQEITDLFFKAQRLGGPEVSANAGKIGELVLSAKGVGVAAEDVVMHVTAMTRATGSSTEAFALMDQILRRLRQPTADLQDAAVRFNGTSVETILQTKGLAGFFELLHKATGGNADRLVDLIGSLRGSTGALMAQGDVMKVLLQLYAEWGAQGQAAGETQKALAVVAETDAEKIRVLTAQFKELAQSLGGLVAPEISQTIKDFQQVGSELGELIAKFERWRAYQNVQFGPGARQFTEDEIKQRARERGAPSAQVAPPVVAPPTPVDVEGARQKTRDNMDQVIKGLTEQIDLLQRIDGITGKGDMALLYQKIREAVSVTNQEIAREEAIIKATTEGTKANEDANKRLNALHKERNDLLFREAQIAKELAQEFKQTGDQFKRAMETFAAAQIRDIMLPVELQSGLRNLRGEMIRGGMTRAEDADPGRVRRIFQEQRQLQGEQFEAETAAINRALAVAVTQEQITSILRKKHDVLLQNAKAQMELNRQEEEAIRNANIRAAQENVARLERRQEMMGQMGIFEGTVFGSDLTPSQLELQGARFTEQFAQMTQQQIEREIEFMQKYKPIVTKQGTYEERLAFEQRMQAAQEALGRPGDLATRQQDIFDKTKQQITEVDDLIQKSLEKQTDLAQKTAAGAHDAMIEAYRRVVAASPQMGALAAQAWLRAFRDQFGNLPSFITEGFGPPGPIPVKPGGASGGTTIYINGVKVDLSERTKDELRNAAVRAAFAGAGDAAVQDENRTIGGTPGGVVR